MIPDYVDCKMQEIVHCDYLMHSECKKSCGYYRSIMGLGVGACCDGGLLKRIKNNAHQKNGIVE